MSNRKCHYPITVELPSVEPQGKRENIRVIGISTSNLILGSVELKQKPRQKQ